MNVEDEIGVKKQYWALMRVVEDQQRAVIMFSNQSRVFLWVRNEGFCKGSGIEDIR